MTYSRFTVYTVELGVIGMVQGPNSSNLAVVTNNLLITSLVHKYINENIYIKERKCSTKTFVCLFISIYTQMGIKFWTTQAFSADGIKMLKHPTTKRRI